MKKYCVIALIINSILLTGCSSIFGNSDTDNVDSLLSSITDDGAAEADIVSNDADSTNDTDAANDTPFNMGVPTEGASVTENDTGDETSEGDLSEGDVLDQNQSEPMALKSGGKYVVGDSCLFTFSNDYLTSPVESVLTVNKIYRGSEALAVVDSYNDNSVDVTLGELQNKDLEYAVVEYTIDLSDDQSELSNISTEIECSITGKDTEDGAIHFEGKIYTGGGTLYVDTDNYKISSGTQSKGRIVFTVPIDCTEYNIKLGSEENYVMYSE